MDDLHLLDNGALPLPAAFGLLVFPQALVDHPGALSHCLVLSLHTAPSQAGPHSNPLWVAFPNFVFISKAVIHLYISY